MSKTVTTHYDVAEHLRTPEEMAAYLEACFEEADGDAAFIAKALGDIARAKGMAKVVQVLTPCSELSRRLGSSCMQGLDECRGTEAIFLIRFLKKSSESI